MIFWVVLLLIVLVIKYFGTIVQVVLYGTLILVLIGGVIQWARQRAEQSEISKFVGFLREDNTNSLVWSSTFTCKDFSNTLIQRAKEKGYDLQYLALSGESLKNYFYDYDSYMGSLGYIVPRGASESHAGHAVCSFDAWNKKLVVEPQSDVVLEEIGGRYIGLYGGSEVG